MPGISGACRVCELETLNYLLLLSNSSSHYDFSSSFLLEHTVAIVCGTKLFPPDEWKTGRGEKNTYCIRNKFTWNVNTLTRTERTDIRQWHISIHIAAAGNSNTVNFPLWIFDSFVVVGVPSWSASVSFIAVNRRKVSAAGAVRLLCHRWCCLDDRAIWRYQIWTIIIIIFIVWSQKLGATKRKATETFSSPFSTNHSHDKQHQLWAGERVETIYFNGLWLHYIFYTDVGGHQTRTGSFPIVGFSISICVLRQPPAHTHTHIVVHRIHYCSRVTCITLFGLYIFNVRALFGSVWKNVCANRRTLSHTYIMIRHIQRGSQFRPLSFTFLRKYSKYFVWSELVLRCAAIAATASRNIQAQRASWPFDGVDLVYLGPSFMFCASFFLSRSGYVVPTDLIPWMCDLASLPLVPVA